MFYIIMHHGNLDFLSIGHFTLYFVIGLFWKHKYIIILVLGILWEIIEHILINNEYTKSLLVWFWPIPEKYINDTFDHSITDIIINMIGYTIGSNLR